MKLFVHQLKAEQLIFWRSREAAVFLFVFPILLFVMLGSIYDGEYRGRPVSTYLLGGLLAYGAANTAFAGIGISLVIRREYGIMKRIRATPLPPATYLTAALVSMLLVFALQATVLYALGVLVFDADPPERPFSLIAALLVGAVAFNGLGLAAASLIHSAEGASAVINVVLLPMAFLSGSFGPTRSYPEPLRLLGEALPLKYLVDLVETVVFEVEALWSEPVDLAVLVAWGLAGLLVAARRFRWSPHHEG